MPDPGAPEAARVASPPGPKPLLVFDGDCGFCRRWVARWRATTGDRVDYAPYQEVAARFPEIPREEFARAVRFIETDGSVHAGAEGVLRALATVPGRGAALHAYRLSPVFAWAAEGFYRAVATHRPALSRAVGWLWGPSVDRPEWHLARDLFLRALGLVYLAAFLSLAVQVGGLVGSDGILPIGPYLDAARHQLGAARLWWLPTLCWIDASDAFLRVLCWGGVALSALVVAGILTAPALILLWLSYLSLTVACRVFLQYQWDALLLETGFLAVFLAPLRLRTRFPEPSEPSRAVLGLVRWLLFRLIFSSGMVKLSSGDPTWRHLTALDYHYFTQPLPTWLAWYASRLPEWFQKSSVLAMFVVELGAPILAFGPRRMRLVSFGAIAGLQALIAITGNYGFFNALTVALCIPLLDDSTWPRRLRDRLARARTLPSGRHRSGLPGWVAAVLLIVIVPLGLDAVAGSFRARLPLAAPVEAASRLLSPFRIVNGYGLFAVMTTERPEIVVEGSEDGKTWLPYEFRFKPGDVTHRPAFVAPYQPRLDWQMWFAALEDYRANPWFVGFLGRLLEGSPEVLALLARNPFPGSPPRYVRAVVYDYRFAGGDAVKAEGAWWSREEKGLYCPVLRR